MATRRKFGLGGSLLCSVCAALLLMTPPAAGGEDTLEGLLRAAKQNREREAKGVHAFIVKLNLTADQARQLVELAAQAAPLHVELYEKMARLQPEMLEAFTEFAREDSLDQGFTPTVEQRTGQLSHEAKVCNETITAKLVELEKQAAAVLTAEQQWIVQEAGPAKAPGNGKHGRPGKHVGLLRGRAREAALKERQEGQPDRLVEARQEMDELQKELHPRLGAVGRNLLHPAAGAELCQIAGTSPNQAMREAATVFEEGTADHPVATYDKQQAELAKLQAEISNWNLINGLHLSVQQIQQIASQYAAVAEEIKAVRQQGPAKSKPKPEREREIRVGLERSVEKVLNPGQRRVLVDFKPCLIPPQNLKSPVRVGQANDNSHLENWLGQARKMPEPRLRKAIGNLLDREAEHFGKLSETAYGERFALLMQTAGEAGKMSDVEFEVNRAELAERIAPCDRLQELKGEVAQLSRERGLPSTISAFMLNDRFVEQLRIRGKQLAAGVGGVANAK